jgi:hypothetical protein
MRISIKRWPQLRDAKQRECRRKGPQKTSLSRSATGDVTHPHRHPSAPALSSCCCACSLLTCLRNLSNNLRPSGPTRCSSLSMISSGVIPPPDESSSAVSHLIDLANATAPAKYACGYFSARISSTLRPCVRQCCSKSATRTRQSRRRRSSTMSPWFPASSRTWRTTGTLRARDLPPRVRRHPTD